MKCQKCAAELQDGVKFCTECGASQATVSSCKHCGESIPVDASFCTSCGKPHSATPTPAEQTRSAASTVGKPQSDDFLFLLSDEKVKGLTAKSDSPVCGYLGVVLKEGKCVQFLKQSETPNNEHKSFWGKLGDIWKNLTKGSAESSSSGKYSTGNSQCYVVMDLAGLPVITYSHSTPTEGFPNAALNFEFWLPPESLGLFLQRCAQGRESLTLQEFKRIASEEVAKIIPNYSIKGIASDPSSTKLIVDDLYGITGISARCFFIEGKVGERKQFDVSKVQGTVYCNDCGAGFTNPMKFCEECGSSMNLADWVGSTRYLLSSDGEQLTLRVSFLELDDGEYFGEQRVAEDVTQVLGTFLRKHTAADLMSAKMLDEISKQLSTGLISLWKGFATDISVIDVKTASEEWFFNADALIKEELRKVEAQKSLLRVDDAQLDLDEAAFAIAMRSLKQRDSQDLERRKASFESRKKEAELEIDEHKLETNVELQKENFDVQVEQQRIDRDREVRRGNIREDRADENDQLDHDSALEKKIAQHDIDLANMASAAQSQQKRKDIDDDTYAKEEALRLKAKEAQDLGNIQEDLEDRQNSRQIDKLRAMAELEANMAKQDHEQELSKSKQDQDFEMSKIESMKSMDAQQMLAMQAAQLAKAAGGGQASADLIKSIADSQAAAAGAGIKDELYSKMLDMQQKSSEAAIQAHKEAAQVAQSTNEKSMEAMSKVATATASRDSFEKSMDAMAKIASAAVTKKDPSAQEEKKNVACVNPDCDAVFKDKVPKFCNKCGCSQS